MAASCIPSPTQLFPPARRSHAGPAFLRRPGSVPPGRRFAAGPAPARRFAAGPAFRRRAVGSSHRLGNRELELASQQITNEEGIESGDAQ